MPSNKFVTRQMKVGFVLASPVEDPLPSTRISVLNVFALLRERGVDPVVLFQPDEATETPQVDGLAPRARALGIDVVYFQKTRGPSVFAEIDGLRRLGIGTVFGVCDVIDLEMTARCDATVVVTDYLRELYPVRLHDRISVVHDGIERPDVQRTTGPRDGAYATRSRPLRAVLVTSSTPETVPLIGRVPDFLSLTIVGRFPERSARPSIVGAARRVLAASGFGETMRRVGDLLRPPFRRVGWDPVGVYDQLSRADIGIIPVDTSRGSPSDDRIYYWQVKSENRLTLKMSVGLPVIASAVPSYLPVIRQGVNGFIARSRDDWADMFAELRSPELPPARSARAARQSVLDRYSQRRQADLLAGVFASLAKGETRVGPTLHEFDRRSDDGELATDGDK